MKRYIIISGNTLWQRDWARFGCKHFRDAGFQIVPVCVVDAPPSDFPVPVLTHESFMAKPVPGDVVLMLPPLSPKTKWAYDWLGDFPYMVISRGALPVSFPGFGMPHIKRWVKGKLRGKMKGPPPRWRLVAGTYPDHGYPEGGEVLPMEHFDLEAAHLSFPYDAGYPYAVYLDQMPMDHPDIDLLGLPPEVEPNYFVMLERFFVSVEKQTGLKVLVAPHPKATARSNAHFKWRISEVPTQSLVRGSSLVLNHYSTATSFAVIFNKPIVFLTTNKMQTNDSGVLVDQQATWLGQKPINIDQPVILDAPKIDKPKYQRYFDTFLSSPNPLSWEQVIERVTC